MKSFYDLKTMTLAGKPADLGMYRGKVSLVVNVASKCGFTPQYEGLEKLQREMKGKPFNVLGFPSNDFAGQEPGSNADIASFCATNYEVDCTVRHYEQPMGGIKRLSVAVVVNYQKQVDAKGIATMQPLSADKLTQVQQLVKDAMGYDEKRGDSVNVVNSAFLVDSTVIPDVPWWRTPDMIARGIQLAKYLGIGAVALFLYFSMVKPTMRRAFPPPSPPPAALGAPADLSLLDGPSMPKSLEEDEKDAEVSLLGHESNKAKFERNLDYARMVARQDPRIVATVVKNWVSDER